MTEPLIRESAPSSSVILAYGTAGRRPSWKTGVLVAVILLVMSFTGAFLWTLFSSSVPIPAATSVLIKLPASEKLADDAPAIWREAKDHSGPFPILVGRTMSSDGLSKAFAITPRLFKTGDARAHRWIWQVLSEDLALETTTTRLTALSRNPLSRSWMRIWPDNLGSGSVFPVTSVGGSLNETAWNTDLPAPEGIASKQTLSGQNFLNLRALPGAWTYVTAILRASGYDLQDAEMPANVEWTKGKAGGVSAALHFDGPLALSTKAHFVGAAGIYDRTETLLGDGSVVENLDLPIELLKNSSSTSWTSTDGRRVAFDGNSVYFGEISLTTSTKDIPKACQAHVIAAFDRTDLGSFFASLGILSTADVQTIYWTEKNKKTSICWG